MMKLRKKLACVLLFSLLAANSAQASEIEPSWESLSKNYQVPKWLLDGKMGVWFHWGIPSATDENRPNDGSWYGYRMYTPIKGRKMKDGSPHVWEVFAQWHIDTSTCAYTSV